MSRLIPLRLRSSSDLNSEEVLEPSSTLSATTRPIPAKSTAGRRRPRPVTELMLCPYTPEEWSKVMEEVKLLYAKRHYKQCSARCIQILDNIKDPYRVHPLHSIYLSFYAASSLELIARSLHLNASNKMPLLQQALTYYQNAESCMEYASFSADPNIIQAARRRSSSISSSIRSSIDSVFSQASNTGSVCSSVTPSPTNSFYSTRPESGHSHGHDRNPSSSSTSTSQGELTAAPLRVKKKVSFYPKLPTVLSEADLASSIEDSNLIDAFPAPPNSPTPPPSHETATGITTYLLSRSLNRYRTHLSALHIQLAYHIGSINAQIHTLQTCRKARRSNFPNLFTPDFGSGGVWDGVDKMEMRKVALQARIERLKESSWRRERFNGERYQLLADRALAELE